MKFSAASVPKIAVKADKLRSRNRYRGCQSSKADTDSDIDPDPDKHGRKQHYFFMRLGAPPVHGRLR